MSVFFHLSHVSLVILCDSTNFSLSLAHSQGVDPDLKGKIHLFVSVPNFVTSIQVLNKIHLFVSVPNFVPNIAVRMCVTS